MGGFGAFGKIPALGDFFRIGISRDFVEPWDDWLQKGLLATKSRLGSKWRACFMSAPIWRFTLSPGQAGPNTVLGVLMPSVDRVGREFPLTLVTKIAGNPPPLHIHFAAGHIFENLENIALDALEDGMSRDMLQTRLQEMPMVPQVGWAKLIRRPGQIAVCTEDGQSPEGALAASFASREFRAPSIWSTFLTDGSRLMSAEGLPNTDQICALFDLETPVWQDEVPGGARQ